MKSDKLYETTQSHIIKHSTNITQNSTYKPAAAPPIARINTPSQDDDDSSSDGEEDDDDSPSDGEEDDDDSPSDGEENSSSSSASLLDPPEASSSSSSSNSSEEQEVAIPEGLNASALGKRVFAKTLEFSKILWNQMRQGVNNTGQAIKIIAPHVHNVNSFIANAAGDFLIDNPEYMVVFASVIAEMYLTDMDNIPNLSEAENIEEGQRIIVNYYTDIMMSRAQQATGYIISRKLGVKQAIQKFIKIGWRLIGVWALNRYQQQQEQELREEEARYQADANMAQEAEFFRPDDEQPQPAVEPIINQPQAAAAAAEPIIEQPQPPPPPIGKFEFLITPENIIELLGPKGGLRAETYIAAIEAYNLANPGSIIDLTGLNKEDFGGTHSMYRAQLAKEIQGKIKIIDTVRNIVLYDK